MATAVETRPESKREIAREPRLLPAHPLGMMRRLSTEMDRVFQELGVRTPFPLWTREFTGEALWSPNIDIVEKETELIVRADLPGLKPEDVKVTATEEALTIEGERKREEKETREGYFRSECTYGSFTRTIPLPEGAMGDRSKAVFKNGVLEITIPVPPRTARKPHTVEVKTV
jgi:HSP20 family protein